jgi:tetratricopeptide (TPR) repeat protein
VFKEQEQFCRQLGNLEGIHGSLAGQAVILLTRRDNNGAINLLKEEERLCRQIGNLDALQHNLCHQAVILRRQGDGHAAMTMLQEQEGISRQLGDLDALSGSLGVQALIVRDRGDLEAAMVLHKEQERLCRQLGNVESLHYSLHGQAQILNMRNDPDGAMALYKETEQICRQLGDIVSLSSCLHNQAMILHDRGDWKGAMVLHKEEEHLYRQLSDFDSLWKCLGNQAEGHLKSGEVDLAIGRFEEAIRLNPDKSDPAQTNWYVNRADAYTKQGNDGPKHACELYNQAIECEHTGNYQAAITNFEKAIQADPEFAWAPNNLAWLLATCVDETVRNGQEAIKYATRACELANWTCWSFLDTLAASCAETGAFGEAAKWAAKALQLAPEEHKAESLASLERYRTGG